MPDDSFIALLIVGGYLRVLNVPSYPFENFFFISFADKHFQLIMFPRPLGDGLIR